MKQEEIEKREERNPKWKFYNFWAETQNYQNTLSYAIENLKILRGDSKKKKKKGEIEDKDR